MNHELIEVLEKIVFKLEIQNNLLKEKNEHLKEISNNILNIWCHGLDVKRYD